MARKGEYRLLGCDCCKQKLPTGEFSGSRHGDYSYFCKSCQVWLRLFREVCSFDGKRGKPRGWQVKKHNPALALSSAWGIGQV